MNRLEGRMLIIVGALMFFFGGLPMLAVAAHAHDFRLLEYSPWLLGGGALIACLGELVRTITAEGFHLGVILGGIAVWFGIAGTIVVDGSLLGWGLAAFGLSLAAMFWSMSKLDRILLATRAG